MLSQVTAKNVGDVFFETHCITDQKLCVCVLTRMAHSISATRSISLIKTIDREFEFYEFFSFLKFNEFYEFFFG